LHWVSPVLRWCRAFSGRVRTHAWPANRRTHLIIHDRTVFKKIYLN
jgi:hypothetical protein